MTWAKEHSLPNWMYLYSYLSNVAHSKPEGIAGHLLEDNEVGEAFRENLAKSPNAGAKLIEDLLGLVCYAILAVDAIAVDMLAGRKFTAFSKDKKVLIYLTASDLKSFRNYLQEYIGTSKK